jgi:hypothetical protein
VKVRTMRVLTAAAAALVLESVGAHVPVVVEPAPIYVGPAPYYRGSQDRRCRTSDHPGLGVALQRPRS